MIHVFKKGGERGTPPNDYSIECINEGDSIKFLADGWHLSLDDALLDDADPDPEPEQPEQPEQETVADTDGDGKLSIDEARAYLDSAGVQYEDGLHWKKVVALAEQHMKGG